MSDEPAGQLADALNAVWDRHDAALTAEINGRLTTRAAWYPIRPLFVGQHAYKRRGAGRLSVIWSVAPHGGGWWLHVSCSGAGIPSHDQMSEVKAVFVGPDRWGYSLWAPEAEHINIAARALHIWAPVDGTNRLPNFGRHGTI